MKKRIERIRGAMKPQTEETPQYIVELFDAVATWPREDRTAFRQAYDTAVVDGQVDGAKAETMYQLLKKNSPTLDNKFTRSLAILANRHKYNEQ